MASNHTKVLLMGMAHAGKTSMRSIIFANYLARDTSRLMPTMAEQQTSTRFLGSLVLNLWDCGGQDNMFADYLTNRREQIFSNVAVLIYVFDILSVEVDKDLAFYAASVTALAQYSPGARIFVLIHKMDLVREDARLAVYEDRAAAVHARSAHFVVETFATSIWDETLYKAWSSVVYALIPNIRALEERLAAFADSCGADEVVLFERATFLVISHAARRQFSDVHRFEKISNIVKQFKLACAKGEYSQLRGLRAGNSGFTMLIEAFTANTFLMVVTGPQVHDEATLLNVALARPQFASLIATI